MTEVKDKVETTVDVVEEQKDVVIAESVDNVPVRHTSGKGKIGEYIHSLSKEQLQEQGRRGQKKRMETLAKKKAMKEQLASLLAMPVKDKNVRKQLKSLGIDPTDIDNQMLMLVVMWQQVMKGRANCVPAFNSLVNVLGEGANSMDLNANLNMSFNNDLPQED